MATSTFPADPATVRLVVRTGSPLAEVFVIDHAFAFAARGIGEVVEVDLEPAVYNVKARLGDATAEQLVVAAEAETTLDLSERLRIGSAAPVPGTRLADAGDTAWAVEASHAIGTERGAGAEVFIMSRRWPEDGGPPPPLALLDRNGEVVLYAARAGSDAVAVDPGAYRLRWINAGGVTVEQALHAVEGWQTQAFVLQEPGAESSLGATRVSVLMRRRGVRHRTDELERAEEARTALADERKVASQEVNELLFGKFDDPMLGLFGAHLMLIARDAEATESRRVSGPMAPVAFDPWLFAEAADNLAWLLGAEHPDVVALRCATEDGLADAAALGPVTEPPLLWRSWVVLVKASNAVPELVPAALWETVRRVLPLRPFLMWLPAEEASSGGEEDDDPWRRGVRRALSESPDDAERARVSDALLVPRAVVDAIADDPRRR